MEKKLDCFCSRKQKWIKLFRVMKLSLMLLLVGVIQLSASVHAQNGKLSVQVENMQLSDLLWQLQEESGMVFIYHTDDVEDVNDISVNISEAAITDILDEVLKDTDLDYTLDNKVVIIKKKEIIPLPAIENVQEKKIIKGKVLDEKGEPLPFAAVCFKGTTTGCVAAVDGTYVLEVIDEEGLMLEVSSLGYVTKVIPVNGRLNY